MKTYSFIKLFDYAVSAYEVSWVKCYRIFIKSGILKYEATTTFYYDDIKDHVQGLQDIDDSFDSDSSLAYHILYTFMSNISLTGDTKIKHS